MTGVQTCALPISLERHAEAVGADRLEHRQHDEVRRAGDARVAIDQVLGLRLGESHELLAKKVRYSFVQLPGMTRVLDGFRNFARTSEQI